MNPHWQEETQGMPAEALLEWAARTFPAGVALASSLGPEDQALTHMIAARELPIRIFTLDTGRLFEETHALLDATRERYGVRVEVYLPDAREVEAMVGEHGVNLFRESVELRKRCCGVRKLQPLRRALSGLDAWIVGLRREQSPTRETVDSVAWDASNSLVKLSPLWNWSEARLWDYLRKHDVPVNALHAQGYPSIGCQCCTRAVEPGQDPRSGRWWWESPMQRECGLHVKEASR